MKPDTSSNGGASVATSPPNRISEADFLSSEADHAKSAITGTVKDAVQEIGHGVDPRAWIKAHPWITLSATALTGFVVTKIAMPSRNRHVLRRLKHIEKALNNAEHAQRDGQNHAKEKRGWLALLGVELIKLLQPMLMGFINSSMPPPAPTQQSDSDTPNPT